MFVVVVFFFFAAFKWPLLGKAFISHCSRRQVGSLSITNGMSLTLFKDECTRDAFNSSFVGLQFCRSIEKLSPATP